MDFKAIGFASVVAIAGVAVAFTPSCGSKGSALGYSSTMNFGGAGSVWNATLTENLTFTITKKETPTSAVVLTVEGTYDRMSSGMLKLTVTSATGTDAPAKGAQAYALDVPGFALLLKPMGSTGGEIIPMVAIDKCPTANFEMAWVKMRVENASYDLSTNDVAGLFNYTHSSMSGAVSAMKKYDGTVHSAGPMTVGTVTCSGGVGTISDGEMYFTSANGAIVQTGGSGSRSAIVGVPAAAITISDFAGDYVGLLFDEEDTASGNTGGRTQPIGATLQSTGAGTGSLLSDWDAGTRDSANTATLTMAQLSTATNGLVKMTVVGGSTETYVCAVAKDIGVFAQEVIFCTTKGTAATKLQSYLLVKKV